MHLQAPARFLSEQIAFVPHGDGLQGFGLSVSTLGGTEKAGDKLKSIPNLKTYML